MSTKLVPKRRPRRKRTPKGLAVGAEGLDERRRKRKARKGAKC